MPNRLVASVASLLLVASAQCERCTQDEPPEAATLTLSFSRVKMFDFDWAEVEGADYYQLLESSAPNEPFVTIEEELLEEGISIVVPLHLRHEASYVLRSCNHTGCTDSAPVSVVGTLADAIGYFKASNTDAGDYFGRSVALSADGNTLAVGALGERGTSTGIGGDESDDSSPFAGAVYVFERDSMGQWSQQAYVKASNPDSADYFGQSVALSADGNTLAVGAGGEGSSATGIGGDQLDDAAPGAGAVYVLTRSPSLTWSQQAYVKASNPDADDCFGRSVALSGDGNTLAVGASNEDSNATGIDGDQSDDSVPGAGAVYVFTRSSSLAWSQQVYVKASNPGMGDCFGQSVALSGDGSTLAVGARGEGGSATGIDGDQSNDSVPGAGAVYVFTRSSSLTWSQQAYVKASNPGMGDYFGQSVALSGDGNTLAVGASNEDGNATDIDENRSDDSVPDAGAVHVFTRSSSLTWSQQAYVKASNPGMGDAFGFDVTLSTDGNVLAVAAPIEDGRAAGINGNQADESADAAGAVYVFLRGPAGQWSQRAYVKASNPGVNDVFGASIALEGDGNTLAVGASGEDGSATGIVSKQADDLAAEAGAVYLY